MIRYACTRRFKAADPVLRGDDAPVPRDFIFALPYRPLQVRYQGWMDTVQALRVARHTGVFTFPSLMDETTDRAIVWPMYGQLESRIAELWTKAKQASRRADINLEFERVRAGLGRSTPPVVNKTQTVSA